MLSQKPKIREAQKANLRTLLGYMTSESFVQQLEAKLGIHGMDALYNQFSDTICALPDRERKVVSMHFGIPVDCSQHALTYLQPRERKICARAMNMGSIQFDAHLSLAFARLRPFCEAAKKLPTPTASALAQMR